MIVSNAIVHKSNKGETMKQLVYFLMVSLAFTALQVATVEAQSVDPTTVVPPTGAPGGPPMGDPTMAPPTGAPGEPPMGDPTMAPPTGAPGGPPMGEDCAGKPTPGEVAACWDRLNNPTPGTPPAGQ